MLPILLSLNGEEIALELKHNALMLNSAHACPVVDPMGGIAKHEPKAAERVARVNPQPKGPPTRGKITTTANTSSFMPQRDRNVLHFSRRRHNNDRARGALNICREGSGPKVSARSSSWTTLSR